MTNQSCKRQKQSLWRRDGGQLEDDQNEQQQQQTVNYSSDNAEVARCLTHFSHSGTSRETFANWTYIAMEHNCLYESHWKRLIGDVLY